MLRGVGVKKAPKNFLGRLVQALAVIFLLLIHHEGLIYFSVICA